MKPRIESCSRRCLRRELLAAVLLAVSGSAWAQPEPLPILTYQRPAPLDCVNGVGANCYQVPGYQISVTAWSYSVPSGSSVWNNETAVVWRTANAATNNRNIVYGSVPPPILQAQQRPGYDFWLDDNQCPTWGCPPRAEFDSSPSDPVNIGLQCNPQDHPEWTWESVGIIREQTSEKIFVWSMFLTKDPALDQDGGVPGMRYWADLNQIGHPAGPADPGTYCNWWPAGCIDNPIQAYTPDCNTWPVCATNDYGHVVPPHILFHTNRISSRCPAPDAGMDCRTIDTEPPRLWDVPMPQYYGQWVDLAMYIKPSTDNTIGKIRFWVNGNEVPPIGGWLGSTFYSVTPAYPANRPFYYVKQGYYRDRRIVDSQQGGVHVYMTPMLVTSPVQGATRR